MRWPLQPLQPLQQTQLQPPFGESVALLCHPWFTTTNVSYRFPVLKLPPAPCGVLLVHIEEKHSTNQPTSGKRTVSKWDTNGPTAISSMFRDSQFCRAKLSHFLLLITQKESNIRYTYGIPGTPKWRMFHPKHDQILFWSLLKKHIPTTSIHQSMAESESKNWITST